MLRDDRIMDIDITTIKKRLSQTLSPHRYQHSLGTAAEAEKLAKHWQIDSQKAYLAGLLHDCAKNKSTDEMLRLALLHNIPVDEWTKEHTDILHGPVAAAMLEEEWGINDNEIADAIRTHTVPEEDMSDLAKIIYLADKIEPNRKPWQGIEKIRALAYRNLDQAIEAMLQNTIGFLAKRSDEVHPFTEEIWQIYRNKIKEQG